jgi:hypothetical protein
MEALSSLRFDAARVSNVSTCQSTRMFRKGALRTMLFFTLLCLGKQVGNARGSSATMPEKAINCATSASTVGLSPEPLMVVDPNVTVSFGNPQFNCTTQEYCLDVRFKSDIANKELFGMNVRFFYDDVILEMINFRDFQGGYGPVAPNPASNTYSATAGPALFNFGGGSDYINGAVQKTNANAPPIYISTTGWTKLYQICFSVDDPNANENSFCPPIVWDLEANPANGGFPAGSAGVVMTVVNGSGSSNALEHVEQFNWAYSGNGTPPYGAPVEITCSSISCGTCNLLVTSTADSGQGSLREVISCATNGDTITFGSALAGATINITSAKMAINKNLFIRSSLVPRVKISSSSQGLFDIGAGKTVEFKDIDITSGLSDPNNSGAAFTNQGNLRLIGVKVYKNANLPIGQYLVRNKPGSQFTLLQNCLIEIP